MVSGWTSATPPFRRTTIFISLLFAFEPYWLTLQTELAFSAGSVMRYRSIVYRTGRKPHQGFICHIRIGQASSGHEVKRVELPHELERSVHVHRISREVPVHVGYPAHDRSREQRAAVSPELRLP